MNIQDWTTDDRYPGWEFQYGVTTANKILLKGRNVVEGLSGEVFINDAALNRTETAILEIDQKVKYLVDCATADPELWLNNK